MKTKIFILLAVLAVGLSTQANAQNWKVERLVTYDALYGTTSDSARTGLVIKGELNVTNNAASLWVDYCTTPAAGSICGGEPIWFMFGRSITKADDKSVTFSNGEKYEILSLSPRLIISSESKGLVVIFTLVPR